MELLEKAVDEQRAWDLVAVVVAGLAGLAVRQALQTGWEKWKEEEPPTNPAARSVDWREALTWSIAVGAAVGLGRMLAEGGAAAGWRRVRGDYPTGLD